MNKIILVFLLSATIGSFAQKSIRPKIGFTPDISGTAKQRFEFKKQKYAELVARIEKGEKYDQFTEPERRLMDEFDSEQADPWTVGSPGCSWYCGVMDVNITASSTLPPQGKNTYVANNAHDFTLNAAWVEGAKGPGIGEYIQYTFDPQNPPITTVIIFNGYVKSDKAWAENGRIKKLKMSVNGKPHAFLELQDVKSEQSFNVGSLQNLKGKLTLKFEILEVYKGTKYEDTVLSELYFDGTGVHCFAAGTMITMADGSLKPIEEVERGDEVLSFNFEARKTESSRVEETVQSMHHNLVRYEFEKGSITATDDHPFYSPAKGWVSLSPHQSLQYLSTVSAMAIDESILSTHHTTSLQSQVLKNYQKLSVCERAYTITRLSRHNCFFANGMLVAVENLDELSQSSNR
ncbi:MAG: NADase-type glycan-binding domain-containing protein [Bacteroidota bacterium]